MYSQYKCMTVMSDDIIISLLTRCRCTKMDISCCYYVNYTPCTFDVFTKKFLRFSKYSIRFTFEICGHVARLM